MIPVEEALERILAGVSVLPAEQVSVAHGLGRVLAEDVKARRCQPPTAVSAMDGYAVHAADVASVPATLRQVGSVPAGQAYPHVLKRGETVRIFTGAALPEGADTIVIQENARAQGERITVEETAAPGRHVRAAGLDFKPGETGLVAGRILTARDVGFAAAMNVPWLAVRRRPRIAILPTGDEIVMPGDPVGPNQIVSSNSLALAAFVTACGGEPVLLGVAPDTTEGLRAVAAGARGADLLLTTGGASVGEHDLVRDALAKDGLVLDFWRVAMRPGKPLLFGRLHDVPVLGLPGNPVSAFVCAVLFLKPAIEKMLGIERAAARETALIAVDLKENDRRQDYLRAELNYDAQGALVATPFKLQDSSMMSVLARAQCLVVRPPFAPAAKAGSRVEIVRLSGGIFGI
ncbi:MAG: gephyrin-like molybdotransferase Glp [Alphaproteobacteria bacterium]